MKTFLDFWLFSAFVFSALLATFLPTYLLRVSPSSRDLILGERTSARLSGQVFNLRLKAYAGQPTYYHQVLSIDGPPSGRGDYYLVAELAEGSAHQGAPVVAYFGQTLTKKRLKIEAQSRAFVNLMIDLSAASPRPDPQELTVKVFIFSQD